MNRIRNRYLQSIQQAWTSVYEATDAAYTLIALYGESGSGKKDTINAWLQQQSDLGDRHFSHGGKLSNGYSAGLYEFYLSVFLHAEQEHPALIHRHEQTLKRLFPFLPCAVYSKEKDLTNLATQDERTRFYHHEYQEKLLHGLYEFFLDYCRTLNRRFVLVIDEAEQLPQTTKTFLKIYNRRRELSAYLRIVLLCDQPLDINLESHACTINFSRMTLPEAREWLSEQEASAEMTPYQMEQVWEIANGNPAKMIALVECLSIQLQITSFLTFDTLIDFYLNLKGETFRYRLLCDYIASHATCDDPIAQRNYQHAKVDLRDSLHRKQLETFQQNDDLASQILHLVHYTSLSNKVEQLCALSPIAIKLQEIGVYDTWFDMFSHYFNDPELRALPDGDQPYNAVFVRMSFILYSLGLAKVSIPYLELFYEKFPESHLIPMILYSQSMTYGRYQVPVNLEKAEKYAMLNLEKIDSMFQDHPKYMYIKVFAENALAYIRARQGRFDEAISLCTVGLEKMVEIYGDRKYALHQSILVYNTGQVYELVNNFEKARETYKEAISLDPQYGEYYNDIANLLQRFGYYEEAIRNYQIAFDLCPPYYEAHINRAGVYEKIGEFALAEQDYQRALVLKPDSVNSYIGLATHYLEQERLEEALPLIDQAIYYNPKDGQSHNNRGLILQGLGRTSEARAAFDEAIRCNPNLHEAYSNRAILAFGEQDYEQSLADLNAALSRKVEFEYLVNRGMLHLEIKQFELAMQDFEQAVEKFGMSELLQQLIDDCKAAQLS